MSAALLIGLAVTAGAPAPKGVPKTEPTIVGVWAWEKVSVGGNEMPVPKDGGSFEFTADGQLVAQKGAGANPDQGSYKLDPKADPPAIDLIPPPAKKDQTMPGIYKLDGDVLLLCFRHGDPTKTARPTTFESPKGSDVILITLRRVTK